MIAPSSSTPLVVLAVIVMAGCAISGMLMGNVGPFNSHVAEAQIPVQQTQGALDSQATQAVLQMAQTQQAPIIAQTVAASDMTLMPLQQAAAQAAAASTVQAYQVQATQTAAVDQSYNNWLMVQATQTSVASALNMQNLAANATATAMAQEQSQKYASGTAQIIILVVGALLVGGWITSRIAVQVMNARAHEKAAQAKLLAEQRQLAALRASIEAQKREQAMKYPTPLSLMKKPDNGKNLPLGE